MIQFYVPDIATTGIMPSDESLHCIRVLRHKEGDEICVTDGTGHRYTARIVEANPRATLLDILDIADVPEHWRCDITLAVAPTKNMDRMEWLTEKGVEIGVNRIVPLLCEHSERKVLKADRLRKIAVSAMKQSLKTSVPTIEEMTPISDFLKQSASSEVQKFMGYCDAQYPRLDLAQAYTPPDDVIIMIGPEGDFSPEEVKLAVEAGFIPSTFGKSRLRTETAAVVALDTVHILNRLRQ